MADDQIARLAGRKPRSEAFQNLDRLTAPLVERAAEAPLYTAEQINVDWGVPQELRPALVLLSQASPLVWDHKQREKARQQSETLKRAWWIVSKYQKSIIRGEGTLPLGQRIRVVDADRFVFEVRSDITAGEAALALNLHQRLASFPNSLRSALAAASRDEAATWLQGALVILRLCIDAHGEAING